MKLIAYGGDSFYTLGAATLQCEHNGKTTEIEFQIVDKPVTSIIGIQDSMRLNLISLGPEVYEVKTEKTIIEEYPDLFDGKLGKLPVTCKLTVDPDVAPVVRPARKIPLAMRDRVKQELDSMVAQGVISPITEPTDWCSNMVCAKKKNKDEIRLCIDPRDLNKALKRPHHPLKTVDDVIAGISDAKVFTVLDAKSSFWQIPLDPDSRKLTCFATPFGRYAFNVLPYGVTVGSEVYQQTIEQIFAGEQCDIIIDDLLIHGRDDEDHDKKLKSILDKCREANLKLNPDKCRFRVESVPYVGHVLSSAGINPDPDKVEAIKKMPIPEDVKGLQRFLGMVNYLSKFIEQHSALTAPLRELLKNESEFVWDENHTKTFQKIKDTIADITTLHYYDVKKEVTINCDASKDGLGAVLLQNEKPIHFASKALTDSEKRMAQIQKELLAVVFSVTKFRHYIYGRSVTVETDHAPLVTIMKKPISQSPASLQKLLLKLQGYDLHFIYKPSRKMYVSDTLSRAYLPLSEGSEREKCDEYDVMSLLAVTDAKCSEIRTATAKDKTCQNIMKRINDGWPAHSSALHKDVRPYFSVKDELVCENGVIMKGHRVVVPKECRKAILKKLHSSHVGIEATKRRAHDTVYWDTINRDIEEYIQKCSPCQAHKPQQQRESIQSFPVPQLPWEIVATDIFEWNNKQYSVLVDSYSGWFEIDKLSSLTSKTIIEKLKQHFSRFGIPQTIYSDSGTQYTSLEFKEFTQKWGIEHHTSSPHYHQANSIAELAVKRAKTLLTKCHDESSDFHLALLEQRNIPREQNLGSPAQRLHSRSLRSTLPVTTLMLKPKIVESVPSNLRKIRLSKKYYYDRQSKNLPSLKKGDIVRIRTEKGHRKLALVKKAADAPRSYIVNSEGKLYRRNRRDLLSTKERANKDTITSSPFLESYADYTRDNQPTSQMPIRENINENAHQDMPVINNPIRRSQRARKQHHAYQHIPL